MTFLYTAALSLALFIVVPVVAHLMRRGRARATAFPATTLIPRLEHVARRRSRFEDRWLLVTRAAILLALALLGAVPLIRCDRTSLVRHQGASVAAILVIDDSASMRSRLPGGSSRFARAQRAAFELVDQMQEGDAIGIVLAGKPARLLLLPTANVSTLRAQLEQVTESDRSTDLQSAIALAESTLERAAQADKQITLLSDLAGDLPTPLSPRVSAAVPELARPIDDCAVLSAIRVGARISVELACSAHSVASERRLQLWRGAEQKRPVSEQAIQLRPGRAHVEFEDRSSDPTSVMRLTPGDDNPNDDVCPIVSGGSGIRIGTYSDPVDGRGTTGGPPVLEQALLALDATLGIKPLTTVPDDARDLSGLDVLFLDDPPLLSAESRATITEFVQRGGIAVGFLGAAADYAQLGSLVMPFIEKRAEWKANAPRGLDPKSLIDLGASASSLQELAPKGRLEFDESHDAKVVVKGRWLDQQPFWIERGLGRGLAVTFGLPTSVDQSDFALRTGFIAILERLLEQSKNLGRTRVVTAGYPWRWPPHGVLRVQGPSGDLPIEASSPPHRAERVVVPTLVGRYRIQFDGVSEDRVAWLPAEEVLESPRPWPVDPAKPSDQTAGRVDLSRPLVIALVLLAWTELALSSSTLARLLDAFRRWVERRLRQAPKRAP